MKPSTAYIITGEKGSGKTTFLSNLHKKRKSDLSSRHIIGIISPKVYEGENLLGYKARILLSGEEKLLCLKEEKMRFMQGAFEYINSVVIRQLKQHGANETEVWIDEIGDLEKIGEGFYPLLLYAVKNKYKLYLSVRMSVVEWLSNFLKENNYNLLQTN